MKTKILVLALILFAAMAWGQEVDCSQIQDKDEKIKCLEKQLTTEKNKNKIYKVDSTSYYKGQSSEVVIDFSKSLNIIAVPNKIRKGDFYQVKVKNFNPNRYSVEIKSNDSLVVKALKLPTFDDFSLDNLSALTSSFSLNFLQTATSFPDPKSLDSLTPNQSGEIEILIEEANSAAEVRLKSQASDLTAIKETWDSLKFEIYKRRLNLLKELPVPNSSDFNFDMALNKGEDLRKRRDKLKVSLQEEQKKYLAIVEHNRAKEFLERAVNKVLQAKVEALKKVYASFFVKIGEFKGLISADNLEKLLKTIVFQIDSNEYISLPIQFKGDVEELSISFVPKDSTSGLQKEILPTLIFPVQNNWYWSVATSFYYSNLSNHRFTSTNTSNSEGINEYAIQELDASSREAGFSTMLKVGAKFKPGGLVGAHVGFGPGISIEKNVRPRLLFGGGISIGRKHNLTLDYGGILGYVDRISEVIPKSGTGEAPNPLATELMIGNYFSIGYMFKL